MSGSVKKFNFFRLFSKLLTEITEKNMFWFVSALYWTNSSQDSNVDNILSDLDISQTLAYWIFRTLNEKVRKIPMFFDMENYFWKSDFEYADFWPKQYVSSFVSLTWKFDNPCCHTPYLPFSLLASKYPHIQCLV